MFVSVIVLATFTRNIRKRLGQRGWPAFLLLIPIFNFYWQYVVIIPLGDLLSSKVKSRDLHNVKVNVAFSRLSCHVMILAVPVLVIFAFLVFASRAFNPLLLLILLVILHGILLTLWLFMICAMFRNYSKAANALASVSSSSTEVGAKQN
jgi:hypothetical protein